LPPGPRSPALRLLTFEASEAGGAVFVEHRRVERPMWDQTFKRWIDLVFWWLPKHEAAQPPAPPAAQPGVKRAPKQAAADRVPEKRASDDLTVIKGIGPVVQQKLQALGIRTFDDLAAADPETLAEQLKGRQPISRGQVQSWTKAADQHAARH
jgi:large subunit ribosomal protein L21